MHTDYQTLCIVCLRAHQQAVQAHALQHCALQCITVVLQSVRAYGQTVMPLCAVQCVECCHTLCVHAGAHGRPVQAHALQHSMQRDSSQGTARHVMQQMSLAMHRKDYDAAQQLFDLELTRQVQSYINGAVGDLHWVINLMSL